MYWCWNIKKHNKTKHNKGKQIHDLILRPKPYIQIFIQHALREIDVHTDEIQARARARTNSQNKPVKVRHCDAMLCAVLCYGVLCNALCSRTHIVEVGSLSKDRRIWLDLLNACYLFCLSLNTHTRCNIRHIQCILKYANILNGNSPNNV